MIGNDVIDLALSRSESNWKRKGFLNKLFTESEKLVIAQSENPEISIWSLWSRKEAVYKIHNRLTGIRSFIPLKIDCAHSHIVIFGGKKYHTTTAITSELIHSIAILEEDRFSGIIDLDRKDIVKRGEIPYRKNGKPASISHHGRFERIVGIQ